MWCSVIFTCLFEIPPSPIIIPINSASSTLFFGLSIEKGRNSDNGLNFPSLFHHSNHRFLLRVSLTGTRPYFAITAIAPFFPAFLTCLYLFLIRKFLGTGFLIFLQRVCKHASCMANFSRLQSRMVRVEHAHKRAISGTESF